MAQGARNLAEAFARAVELAERGDALRRPEINVAQASSLTA
jgi:hypothetical protein